MKDLKKEISEYTTDERILLTVALLAVSDEIDPPSCVAHGDQIWKAFKLGRQYAALPLTKTVESFI